jgi:lantibiotic modifying enzyme
VFGQTFVQDAGFCHGSAGLSSIYLNIFDLTKNDVFKETAEFWLNESIKYSNDKEAICGYSFNLGGTTYGSNISLLSGVAGVLVSYIAALNPKVNEQLGRLFFLR